MKAYIYIMVMAAMSLFTGGLTSCSGANTVGEQETAETAPQPKIKEGPKSVLIISSSPRRGGNSETICEQFRKGAEEAGHRVEMLNLNDYDIRFFDKTEYVRGEEESEEDDAVKIIRKMEKADVIVLASPVYFYSMTAQMKALIDRTYNHEKNLAEKEFYYIVTSTDRAPEALEGTVEGFRGFAKCLYKSVERGIVHGNGARERGAILNHPAMQEAYDLGKGV